MKQIVTFCLVLCTCITQAQELAKSYTFTLEEAIQFALDSSYTAINAKRDITKAMKRKWETTADGLPQINADIAYQNNIKQPVNLLPAELAGGQPGTFIPVVFGTKQNMNATATASQIIFDGSYIVAVRAAKTYLKYTNTNARKTALEIRQDVIDSYGNVLLAKESVEILKSNLATLEKNYRETKAIYENGLQEEEAVEQLEITYSQVNNQLNNAKRLVDVTKDVLNLTLGIPLEHQVNLAEDLNDLTEENISLGLMNENLNLENTIEYQLAQNLIEQRTHEYNLEKAKALPRLTTFLNYGTAAFSQEFSFLDSDQNWFQSSMWGVNLSIPIFSSLKRSAKSAQARIALEQAETQFTQAQEQIRLAVEKARNDYQFAIENYQTAKRNLNLAERIEKKNQIKFQEGLASSFELRQAQTQLYTTQQEFLESMVNVLNAKAALETLLNTPNITLSNN